MIKSKSKISQYKQHFLGLPLLLTAKDSWYHSTDHPRCVSGWSVEESCQSKRIMSAVIADNIVLLVVSHPFPFEQAQWAWNEPRLTRGAAQIGLRTVFTCGPLIMKLSITKSRIELIKTYFTFLLSRNVDNFNVITTGLFHFCVNMNVKNTLKLYLKCSSKTTYTATEHK